MNPQFLKSSATIIALTLATACSQADEEAGQSADSLARDLTLAPAESAATLRDAPVMAAPPPAPRTAPPARRTETTRTRTEVARPAAPTTLTAPAGTQFELAVTDSITSRTAKAGDAFSATVVEDVKDAQGRVVIAAGSIARGTIAEVKPAPNSSQTGTLTLAVSSITVRGTDYPLDVSIDSVETVHKGRGVSGGDAAKVGAGAAAGAILGRVIGGNKKGTIIGGAVGAVVGAGVAVSGKDVDIVLPQGAHIRVTLAQPLSVKAS